MGFIIFVQQMQNVFGNNYLFLCSTTTFFDVYITSSGRFFLCTLKLHINKMETFIQVVVTQNK